MSASSLARSMSPLNGCRLVGSCASSMITSTNVPPASSWWRRVVVKYMLPGTHWPGLMAVRLVRGSGPPALVGGPHVAVSEAALDRPLEAVEVAAAGVGLVAEHDGRPLAVAHRVRPGVGQEGDVDVVGTQEERGVPRLAGAGGAGGPRAGAPPRSAARAERPVSGDPVGGLSAALVRSAPCIPLESVRPTAHARERRAAAPPPTARHGRGASAPAPPLRPLPAPPRRDAAALAGRGLHAARPRDAAGPRDRMPGASPQARGHEPHRLLQGPGHGHGGGGGA